MRSRRWFSATISEVVVLLNALFSDGFTKVRDMLDTGDDFFEVLRNEAGFRPSMRLEIERELDRNLPKKLLEKYSKKRVY